MKIYLHAYEITKILLYFCFYFYFLFEIVYQKDNLVLVSLFSLETNVIVNENYLIVYKNN